jgi:hypothetical protein
MIGLAPGGVEPRTVHVVRGMESPSPVILSLYFAALRAAQRFFCPSAIRFRAAVLTLRFFGAAAVGSDAIGADCFGAPPELIPPPSCRAAIA